MSTTYYVDNQGKYLGAFVGNTGKVPVGAIQVLFPPNDARQIYNFNTQSYGEVVMSEDEMVSAELIKQGYTSSDKIQALWNLAKGDSTLFDEIEAISDQVKGK